MTKKKTIYDRLFDIFFIAYVTCVFCFNDSTSGIKYVYISMILVTGIAFLSLISGGTRLNVKAELVLLLLYLAYGCLVSMKAVYSVPVALERARTVDSPQIRDILHDANRRIVAARVGADGARTLRIQIAANRANLHGVDDVLNRFF